MTRSIHRSIVLAHEENGIKKQLYLNIQIHSAFDVHIYRRVSVDC